MVRKSITTVLIGCITLAILTAIAGIVWYVGSSSYRMALDLETQSITQFADVTAENLTRFLDNADDVAATLTRQDAVKAAYATGDATRARDRLKAFMETYAETYWAMFCFDEKGVVLAGFNADGADMAGQQRGDRDYVKAILGGAKSFFTPTVMQAKSGDLLILGVARPVAGPDGKVAGGVAIFPKWSVFTEQFIDPWRFGARGYGFIFDGSGRMVAHAVDKTTLLKDYSTFDFVKLAMGRDRGTASYDWRGERKFMAFRAEPRTGLTIGMSAYYSEMTETATDQRNVLIGIGAAAVLLLGLIVTLIIRRLVQRPVAVVETFTRKVAGGDFKAELPDDFRYEFARLADNIRAMVGQLKERLGFAQGILDAMTISCVVADPEERIVFVNEPCLRFLEQDGAPRDYHGKTVSELFYGVEGRDTVTGRALREGRAVTGIQVETTTHKGNRVFTQIDAAPLHDLDGKLIAAFALFSDLTSMKEREELIASQNKVIADAAERATSVADLVASAAEELSAQIEESTRGTEEQRGRTAETATAMEQMNASVMQAARSVSDAAGLAEKSRETASAGEQSVTQLIRTIEGVNTRAEALKDDMTALGRQAEDIGRIMGVIADIADQTNLLALNAAIEAARAGDAGRGFAVVADEVRKLAEKTMIATRDVGAAVTAIQQSTRASVAATEEATTAIRDSTVLARESGDSLHRIVAMIEETSDSMRIIAAASEEQSAAAESVASATEDVTRIASETAEAMSQSSQAVADLARLASELRGIIESMHAN